jgi:hypothetical protein
MKARGNCPECHLRDVTHVVAEPGHDERRLCGHCASVYLWNEIREIEPAARKPSRGTRP